MENVIKFVCFLLDLYRLLNKIKQDFDMSISTETLRGYVVPHLLDKNVKVPTLLAEFRSCGIGLSSALSAIVYHLLLRNKLREAAEIGKCVMIIIMGAFHLEYQLIFDFIFSLAAPIVLLVSAYSQTVEH